MPEHSGLSLIHKARATGSLYTLYFILYMPGGSLVLPSIYRALCIDRARHRLMLLSTLLSMPTEFCGVPFSLRTTVCFSACGAPRKYECKV